MSKQSKNVCRTCLVEYEDMTSVFATDSFLRVSYSEIISSVTGLEVKPTDNLTTYICPKCKHDAKSAYEYKTQARNADEALRKAVTNSSARREWDCTTIDGRINRKSEFKFELNFEDCGEKNHEEDTDDDDFADDDDDEFVPCSYENAQAMKSYCSICGEGFDNVITCVEHIRSHDLSTDTGGSLGVTHSSATEEPADVLEEARKRLRPRKNKRDVRSCHETLLNMKQEFVGISKPGQTTKYTKDASTTILSSRTGHIRTPVCNANALDSDADSSTQDPLIYESDGSNTTDENYYPHSSVELTKNDNRIPKGHIIDDKSIAKSRVVTNIKRETILSNVDDDIRSPEAPDRKNHKGAYTDINFSILEGNDVENVNMVSSTNGRGSQSWNKAHACLYCSALVKKLPRHLECKHAKEKAVIEFVKLPIGSKNRKMKIEVIRQLGNYSYNCKVLKGGKGKIIPKRRSKKFRDVNDMAACTNCYGLYVKKDICSHYKCCVGVTDSNKSGGKKGSISMFAYTEKSSKFQEDILSKMQRDGIYLALKKDATILKLGRRLYNKYKSHPHRHTYVIQRMRHLARVLIEVRTIEPLVQNISQMIHPNHFDSFIKGVKVVVGCKKNGKTHNIPSLAGRLKNSVQECADVLKTDAIKITDFNRLREIEDFSNLISMCFTTAISIYTMKWNKSTTLQLATDLQKLTEYLAQRAVELIKGVTQKVTTDNWSELCDVTLVQTLIFNRCPPGEIESVFIKNYLNRDFQPLSDETLKGLSEVEKHLTEMLTMFETRGKLDINVPILLTKELKKQIDLLCSKRNEINIPFENPYLFANPGTSGFKLSATRLYKYAMLCKAEMPAEIILTEFRSNVATACQLLNLKDDEIDQLASYMNNDTEVHKEFFQWPENSLQVEKVSQFLLSLLKGNVIQNDEKNFDNTSTDSYNEDDKDEQQGVVENQSEHNTEVSGEMVNEGPDENTENTVTRGIVQHNPRKRKNSDKQERKKKIVIKTKWTGKEIDAVTRQMAKFWMQKTVPNKADCDKCLENEPALMNRTWRHIKYYVHNMIQKNKI